MDDAKDGFESSKVPLDEQIGRFLWWNMITKIQGDRLGGKIPDLSSISKTLALTDNCAHFRLLFFPGGTFEPSQEIELGQR
jgi:hypothetical protein